MAAMTTARRPRLDWAVLGEVALVRIAPEHLAPQILAVAVAVAVGTVPLVQAAQVVLVS